MPVAAKRSTIRTAAAAPSTTRARARSIASCRPWSSASRPGRGAALASIRMAVNRILIRISWIVILWSSSAYAQTTCEPGTWRNLDSDAPAPAGLGLREPPVPIVYGVEKRDGRVVWPRCAALTGSVRVPVLMIDWQDFDPRVNPSNENNPASTFPDYVASTPVQLQAYLQSQVA